MTERIVTISQASRKNFVWVRDQAETFERAGFDGGALDRLVVWSAENSVRARPILELLETT